MQSTLRSGKYTSHMRADLLKLRLLRHPKIIEDEKAIEVVLRLEEDLNPSASGAGTGRRLTVTAIGSHVDYDLGRTDTEPGSIMARVDVTQPAAVQPRRSSSVRGGDRISPMNGERDMAMGSQVAGDSHVGTLEPIDETVLGISSTGT